MKKPIAITLQKPCEESWDAMTPAKGGRHCGMCSKTVVDFTLMSDGEILDYFKQAKRREVCGNFLDAQLNRPLTDTRYKPAFVNSILKQAAAVTVLLQAISFTSLAQQVKKSATVTQHTKDKKPVVKKGTLMLKGRVVDIATGKPVSGISISIRETNVMATTGSDGSFILSVPTGYSKSYVVLGQSGLSESIKDQTFDISAIKAGEQIVLNYCSPQVVDTTTIRPEDIRKLGGADITDLVSVQPAIYLRRGGAGLNTDAGRSTNIQYVIDGVKVPQPTFWQRITKPFRRKARQ